MTRTSLLLAAGLTAVLGVPAAAQTPLCRDTETLQTCRLRAISESQAGALTEDQRNELQREATGPGFADLAASAIRDFLPRFAGELLTSEPTSDLTALNLRFNTRSGADTSGATRLAVQGELTLHQGEVFAGLRDSVSDSARERLAEGLEDGDDASLSLSVNLENARLGRTFGPHRDLIDSFARALVPVDLSNISAKDAADVALEQFWGRLAADSGTLRKPGTECRFGLESSYELSCLTPAGRLQFESVVRLYAESVRRRQTALTTAIESTGFDRISDLINNQPQLNFTVEYRSRLAVVGPNEWTGRARWEVGGSNMNRLRRFCAALPQLSALECLRTYTHHGPVRRSLERGERAWVEAVARYRPRYQVALPEDSVSFSTGAARGFGVSAGYGSYLGSIAAGEERDRLDVHLSYDLAYADDLRQNRWLAGAFYTLRLSGNASGVVGVAWANRPEFVGGADRRLHANIGLTYKINRGTPAVPGAGTDP